MFGGFNSEYFNDLHYINVTDGFNRPRKYTRSFHDFAKFINDKSTADLKIGTIENESVYCHKSLLMQNFESEQKLQEFLLKIN